MRTNTTRGFTLTELMTVVAIMGALLAIAAINVGEYLNRTKLRRAAEEVAADIRFARWIARTSAETCSITFDVASGTYSINGTRVTRLPSGLRFGADPTVLGRPNQPSDPPPADGITFDSGRNRNMASFHWSGAVTPTGTVFLTNDKETMAVTVSLYGRPKIWHSTGGGGWTPM